jgi:hypothetical protein
MEGLVNRSLLRARTATHEWIVPDGHDFSTPPDGYVVSFMHFHERGLVAPQNHFLQGLLHHIVTFIVLCEGYLGIEPHFDLWRYFFSIDL